MTFNKLIGLFLFTALLVVGAVVGYQYFRGSTEGKSQVNCEVKLNNNFGILVIDSASCINQNKGCLIPFSTANPLDIFSTEGKIVFDSGDSKRSQSFDISKILGSETFRANLCTGNENVVVSVLNDNGVVVKTKSVSVI